jgi:hypothetical protein
MPPGVKGLHLISAGFLVDENSFDTKMLRFLT